MGETHLVVDGSNIATEGRSLPSLQQLMDAVDAVSEEFSPRNVTVIVDATFGHRIDAAERDAYEKKINNGEIITPPAGVIGRGDAFILEVADRADAIVLSNDSFQEFHGTYEWLFDEGRLIGGKHVPGVGWIFLARSPVRGPTSRRAVSDAKRKRRGSKKTAKTKPSSERPSSRSPKSTKKSQASGKRKVVEKETKDSGRKRGGKEPEPYNEPLPFIEFVGAHPVGSVIEAEVEQFSSHGAYVVCDGTRCYISLKSISDPPPRSAREVLTMGETREFVVQAIDTPRRGIDLAMPGMESIDPEDVPGEDERAAEPTTEPATESAATPQEALGAETAPSEPSEPAEPEPVPEVVDEKKLSVSQRRKLRARRQAESAEAEAEAAVTAARAGRAAGRKAPKKAAKKAAASKKGSKTRAKKAPAKKRTTKAASSTRATAKKTPAKKRPAEKRPAEKRPAKKRPAEKRAKKTPAKKTPAKKMPAKKSSSRTRTASKKATAQKAPAKKTAGKTRPAKKAPAKKAPARKRSARPSSDDADR